MSEAARSLRWPGVPLALASAALFGASTPLAKLLLGEVGPWMLAGLLYLGSGLGLGAVRLIEARRGGEAREAPLRRADLPWLGAVILAGGIAGPVLSMIGLAGTAAPAASLLLNLEGVFTLAIAWIVFRENVDARIGAGAAAILLGALLLSWSGEAALRVSWPALAIGAACLAWAVDNNLTRKLARADPLEIAMVKGLAAGSVNLALAAALGARWPGLAALSSAGVLGFLGYGVSLTFFVLALRHLGAARTGAYFSTAPFIGALLGFAIFGGGVSIAFLAAAALMAFGLWMHLSEDHAHEHVHDAMVHEHRHVHDLHHRHAHGPGDPTGEPHTHRHAHPRLVHRHPHYPDLHHRHSHSH
jgi:drug/metabolite transporter (DMT)-like permease